ncbi:MAG: DUF3850 domain-containing protein [Deltaproteobacteria bacterium]|nr:DUF3850 domain-containing protein [Deltaproteobacteria bacterium]
MSNTHELKTWPESYEPIEQGLKPFEIRLNDRDYRVGDILILREFDPGVGQYTGRATVANVRFILAGEKWGLKPGYVAMSIDRKIVMI